jgi:hypothetical protein
MVLGMGMGWILMTLLKAALHRNCCCSKLILLFFFKKKNLCSVIFVVVDSLRLNDPNRMRVIDVHWYSHAFTIGIIF